MKKFLASVGLASLLVTGLSVPAQAASFSSWSCSIRTVHVGADLYRMERWCPAGSIWKKKVKVSETYRVIKHRSVLV